MRSRGWRSKNEFDFAFPEDFIILKGTKDKPKRVLRLFSAYRTTFSSHDTWGFSLLQLNFKHFLFVQWNGGLQKFMLFWVDFLKLYVDVKYGLKKCLKS